MLLMAVLYIRKAFDSVNHNTPLMPKKLEVYQLNGLASKQCKNWFDQVSRDYRVLAPLRF